jgi:hypothetical protein
MADIRAFHTKVAGITHQNDDGSERQRIASQCRPGEPLVLIPDPDNPHDENAIRVCRAYGEQLGFLNSELAPKVAGG